MLFLPLYMTRRWGGEELKRGLYVVFWCTQTETETFLYIKAVCECECVWMVAWICVCVCVWMCMCVAAYLLSDPLTHSALCWGGARMRYRAGGRERGQAHCGWGRLSVSRIVPTHRPLQNYRLTVSDRERAGESERWSEGGGECRRGERLAGMERDIVLVARMTCQTQKLSHIAWQTHRRAHTHVHSHTHTHTQRLTHTHTHIEAHACKKNYHLSKSQHETVLN